MLKEVFISTPASHFMGPSRTGRKRTIRRRWSRSGACPKKPNTQGLGFSLEALQDRCCVAMGPTQSKPLCFGGNTSIANANIMSIVQHVQI
jgi:hypothetical protein